MNGRNHSASIVSAIGTDMQTTFSRRDRGYFHYMTNVAAFDFNSVSDSGRELGRDTFAYFATCQDDNNTYLGTKEPNYFMGPTLYNSRNTDKNIVNRLGELCGENEECFFLHSDMLHEAPR